MIIDDFESNRDIIMPIRIKVFVQEYNVPFDEEEDEWDKECTHVVLKIGDVNAACGRVKRDGTICRIAVLPEYRGQGLGSKVISALEELVMNWGGNYVCLGSLVTAQGFYKKLGYTETDKRYVEVGLQHVKMEKKLKR